MTQADAQPSSVDQDIAFTSQALQSLALRGIDRSDVIKAVRAGSVRPVDDTTGRFVSRMGDVLILSRREGGRLVVMTAIRRNEFPDDAG